MFISGRMDTDDVVDMQQNIYSAVRKNKIMPFAATWMDLEIIILNEVSQTEQDKHHMISLICGI